MNTFILLSVAAFLAAIVSIVGKRYARRFQLHRRIRVDRFKLKRRHADIELEVFASAEVVDAIRAYAKTHRVTTDVAAAQARTYLAEILPKFNLLAYYRFGAPIAGAVMHFLYRVVVEKKTMREFNERATRGVVVFVINHRSNVDYVLVAHMLFKFISLSYAVGEWARVWPLNHLFKWFGAYFIRRRYREPLYHAVLATFVRTITRHGVTQGIFIEGGLSRDGAFQKPKLGMLDYIVTAKRDPAFSEPLFLIPTSINYDRVLEDRNLTEELLGKADRSTRIEKLNTTLEFLFKNALRSLLKRFKRYGYAMVTFGEPVVVDQFIEQHPAVLAPSFDERKPHLIELADRVMQQISRALPVTPVTLLARIFAAQQGSDGLTEATILAAIDTERERSAERMALLGEATSDAVWRVGRDVLTIRKLIAMTPEGFWRWEPSESLLRDYYANSLLSYDEVQSRGWPASVTGTVQGNPFTAPG